MFTLQLETNSSLLLVDFIIVHGAPFTKSSSYAYATCMYIHSENKGVDLHAFGGNIEWRAEAWTIGND